MPNFIISVVSSIAFIDSALPDIQNLCNGIAAGIEVITIDRARDGVAQITEVLGSRNNIKSIHIISHGRSASLQLGAIDLNLTNLNFYGEKLRKWSIALVESAEILLYGCEVAAGDAGAKFVQQISLLTKAKIAAATKPVGSATKGGDWKLDYTTGSVESELAIDPATMAAYEFVFGSFLYDGISNFPAGVPAGIGASGRTELGYGQVPLPGFGGLLPAGAFSPNTGINTASVTAANNTTGYAGYTNYRYSPPPPLPTGTFTRISPALPALDRTNGYSVSFRVAVAAENSNSNDRAGFSIIAISSDGLNGIELGFTNRNFGPNGGIFAQNGGASPTLFTRGESANAPASISNLTDYKLVVQGSTYTLFAGGTAIPNLTNQPLRNYTAFNPATSQPALPYNPYSQPNFLFFGDATDQASATFALGPISVNSLPIANPDTYTTLHDRVLNGFPSVLINDTDSDNLLGLLVPALVKAPSNGKLVFNPFGDFTYTPNPGFVGIDTFTYSLSDGTDTVPGTVSINVTNKQPIANPDTYKIEHDKVLTGFPTVLLNDFDFDPLETLTAALVTGPTKGKLVFNSKGDFTYTPNPGFVGIDTFTYSVSDGAATVPATVSIDVTNIPPIANPDNYTVTHDRVLTGFPGVLSNDVDFDFLETLSAAVVTAPTKGKVALNPKGDFIYTPNPGFVGIDTFTYSASDGAATVPGTVNINVTNSVPIAQPDTYSISVGKALNITAPGVLANDSDADLDTLTAALSANPTKGKLAFNPKGDFIYTPNTGFSGTDTFTYTVSDGIVSSAPATVTVNVNNNPPVAIPDSYTTTFNTPLNVTGLGVLINDTDAENDPLTAILVAGPTKGAIGLNAKGSFSYTPNADFAGTDSFTYKANDGKVDSAIATATIIVNNPTSPTPTSPTPTSPTPTSPTPTSPTPTSPTPTSPTPTSPTPTSPTPTSPTPTSPTPTSPTPTSPTPTSPTPTSPTPTSPTPTSPTPTSPTPTETPTPTPTSPTPTSPTPTSPTPTSPTPTSPTPTSPTPTSPTPTSPTPTSPTPISPTPISPTPTETPTPTSPTPTSPTPTSPTPTSPTPTETPTPTGAGTGAPPLQNAVDRDCSCEEITLPAIASIPGPNAVDRTFNGTDGDDFLIGSNLNDVINGVNGDDILIGARGNDNIYGGFPSDIPIGGDTDDDLLSGGNGNDYLNGNAGNDLIFSGKGNDVAIGGKDDDLIWGDKGNDTLVGAEGNDCLFGGTFDPSNPDLTGRDLLFGDEGNDFLNGGDAADTLGGGEGDDTVYGGKGDDVLVGGNGDDLLLGDRGADRICGGAGNDTIFGESAIGLNGEPDSLCGGEGNDLMFGNASFDELCGDSGNDTIYGGKGDDSVAGSIGDDWLIGGLGNDTLQGGSGRDYFILTAGQGSDVVTDFTKGEDLLVLTNDLKFDRLSFIQQNNATFINIANTGELLAVINGVSAIGQQDFTII